MKKTIINIAFTASLASSAFASDVGLPPTVPGGPGSIKPIDLCELIGDSFCDPKPVPECKPGSLVWPQCLYVTGGEIPWPQGKLSKRDNVDIDWGKFFKSGDTSRVTQVNSASASIDEDKVYIHVQGKENTGGWSNIRLKPKVYFVPPADGIQEITFIGEKPLDYATMALEDVSASLTMSKPDWLNGFRIIAGSNSIEVRPQSNNKRIVVERQEGDGEYWPFPWRQTAAKQ